MKNYLLLVCIVLCSSCNDGNKTEKQETTPVPSETEDKKRDWQSYTSQKWHFSAEFPDTYKVFEGELPGEAPVVNFYDPQNEEAPPYGIHNDATASYIAFLPEGFGVDGPGGPRKSLAAWKAELPISFNIDPENSFAYLMESGEPWAISLRFNSPPPGWNQYGGIYIFYKVENFRAECFSSETGEEISMEQCNALGGDAMKFYGNVSEESKNALNGILGTLFFIDPEKERREISDLIQVQEPQVEEQVSSPLQIKGKARGYWFFEAQAPFKLVDSDFQVLAEGAITADGSWMTEDFVPFSAEVPFNAGNKKRGYLILSRANASGKPEHDREVRIPVVF